MMTFQIWFVPTERAKKSPYVWALKAIGSPSTDPDELYYEAYLLGLDGRAPDQDLFFSYKVYPCEDCDLG